MILVAVGGFVDGLVRAEALVEVLVQVDLRMRLLVATVFS